MVKSLDISYDFGELPIGFHANKTIKVFNDQTEVQDYEVYRDHMTNPLAHVFEIKPYSATVEPSREFCFTISFTPVLPNTCSCDYFTISSSAGNLIKIDVKGKCIGPYVFCNDQKLVFLCMDLKQECQKHVVLKNSSDCCATFQFDIDERQSIFKVSKKFGTIHPHKSIKIKVTFEPRIPGYYIKRLFCLLRYQHPIMIEAVGLCTAWQYIDTENINILRYPQMEVIRSGYLRYLSDNLTIAEHIPPLTLSKSYLDFGQRDVNNKLNIPFAVSVTNHTKEIVSLKWDIDKASVFSIKPKSAMIPTGQSALFEAYFHPNKEGEMYSIELCGYGYWKDGNDGDIVGEIHQIKVPIPISIRMIGHSFSLQCPAWNPHYDLLPQNVILPALVPQQPAFTTFMIINQGQNPLMFKLIPPNVTNYTVKPMQGIIRNNFQTIVVQIFAEKAEETAYIERWGLQLNGSSTYEVHVDFQAYAEYPNIQVGRRNLVIFPATFPGCEQSISVPIRNKTRHCLSYCFLKENIPGNYNVFEDRGILTPNQKTSHLWKFIPQMPGEHLATLRCEAHILKDGSKHGRPVDIIIVGFGYSEYVELLSFPETIDFGISPWGVEKKSFFHIFNFGSCQIHYTLKLSRPPLSKDVIDVSLHPAIGTLQPSGRQKITVTLNTSLIGFNSLSVTYDVRKSPESDIVIKKLTHNDIMRVQYTGVFPSLSVEDIRIQNASPVFNKALLWRMLNINRINKAINDVQPGCMIEVPLLLPAAPIGAAPITIYMLLKNNSGVSIDWEIKRFKNCDCKLIEVERYMSFRCKVYKCPHRSIVRMYPLTDKLEPNESKILHIETKYKTEGEWKLKYIIHLSNDRKIMFTLTVIVLNPDEPIPICESFTFKLLDISLGDEDPVAQVFWFYNNGNEEVTYEIDVTPFFLLKMSNYCVDIIKCLNPRGRILPKTNHPIIFGFNPLELKEYEVKCPMRLGENHNVKLQITGSGSINYSSHIHALRNKMPESRKFTVPEDTILMSIQHIVIDPITIFSSVRRVFSLENISSYLFEYQWYSYEIPGVLEAKVLPQTNYLPPSKSTLCQLIVKTFGQPCLITFPVTCKCLNVTKRSQHGKSNVIHSSVSKALEGYFTIIGDTNTIPVCNVPIEPKPTAMYISVSVTCSIQSRKSFEENVPFCKQMRRSPNKEIIITSKENSFDSELFDLSAVTNILEIMIWDIVFSKWFRNLLEQLEKQETPYYHQISMSSAEHSQLSEESFIIPRRRLIASVLGKMIYESLHVEFKLEKPLTTYNKPSKQIKKPILSSASIDKLLKKAKTEGKIRVPIGW